MVINIIMEINKGDRVAFDHHKGSTETGEVMAVRVLIRYGGQNLIWKPLAEVRKVV